MYREQNYIFSFTFVYKPKMASLIKKITKKNKNATTQSRTHTQKPTKTRNLDLMDAEDSTPVHLSCELLISFALSLDTNGIIFFTVTEMGKGTELLKFKLLGCFFFFFFFFFASWRHLYLVVEWNSPIPF